MKKLYKSCTVIAEVAQPSLLYGFFGRCRGSNPVCASLKEIDNCTLIVKHRKDDCVELLRYFLFKRKWQVIYNGYVIV